MLLSTEAIRQFAPDQDTFDQGQRFSAAKRWKDLGARPPLVWGQSKSRGALYYKTLVDLKTQWFSCTCPSRKYPCRHVLGLFLMHLNDSAAFLQKEDLPEWVEERQPGLQAKSAYYEEKPLSEAEKRQKEAARQQTREDRLARMEAGMQELQSWLRDVIGQGLASLHDQPEEYWEGIASRMVDAKLGAIGRRIRQYKDWFREAGWHEELLLELGELYLMVQGFQRFEELPEPLQQELLTQAGVSVKKEDLLHRNGLTDQWIVCGKEEGSDNNLGFRRVWIYGMDQGRTGLILDFSWGDQGFDQNWEVGQQFGATVVYYPGGYPQRVVVGKIHKNIRPEPTIDGFENLTTFGRGYAAALGENPWLQRFPAFLLEVWPVQGTEGWLLIDNDRNKLSISLPEQAGYVLMSTSGGDPITVFGTYNGRSFKVLSVLGKYNLVSLTER